MLSTTLNPTQLFLLEMFAHNGDEEQLKEVKKALVDYYNQKLQKDVEKVWNEKNLNNDTMYEWLNTHMRTPYK